MKTLPLLLRSSLHVSEGIAEAGPSVVVFVVRTQRAVMDRRFDRHDRPRPQPLRCPVVGEAVDEEVYMSVARITEISSTSPQSFEDAIQQGIARATKTLRNVTGA